MRPFIRNTEAQLDGASIRMPLSKVEKEFDVTYLRASMMPQIAPVRLELAMIIHVHQLMRQRMLHLLFTPEMAITESNGAQRGSIPS